MRRRTAKEAIAAKAWVLLIKSWSYFEGNRFGPPTPVDEIVEFHFKRNLRFEDLRALSGSGEVLCYAIPEQREVVVDQSLDPTVHPEREGRYRFTLAHEIGHMVLHGKALERTSMPRTEDPCIGPARLLRTPRMEWEADYFAACLLMPQPWLEKAWMTEVHSSDPWVFTRTMERAARENGLPGSRGALFNLFADDVAEKFTPKFKTSVETMRIRLVELRLVRMGV